MLDEKTQHTFTPRELVAPALKGSGKSHYLRVGLCQIIVSEDDRGWIHCWHCVGLWSEERVSKERRGGGGGARSLRRKEGGGH